MRRIGGDRGVVLALRTNSVFADQLILAGLVTNNDPGSSRQNLTLESRTISSLLPRQRSSMNGGSMDASPPSQPLVNYFEDSTNANASYQSSVESTRGSGDHCHDSLYSILFVVNVTAIAYLAAVGSPAAVSGGHSEMVDWIHDEGIGMVCICVGTTAGVAVVLCLSWLLCTMRDPAGTIENTFTIWGGAYMIG